MMRQNLHSPVKIMHTVFEWLIKGFLLITTTSWRGSSVIFLPMTLGDHMDTKQVLQNKKLNWSHGPIVFQIGTNLVRCSQWQQ